MPTIVHISSLKKNVDGLLRRTKRMVASSSSAGLDELLQLRTGTRYDYGERRHYGLFCATHVTVSTRALLPATLP